MKTKVPQLARLNSIFIACICGLALQIVLFYPGFMSIDSAQEYAQVISHQYTDVHPILFTLIWSHCDALIQGPAGFFILLQVSFWLALGLIWQIARWRSFGAALILFLLGSWPAIAIINAHLWKDVAMTSSLLLGAALLFHFQIHRRKTIFLFANVCLLAATCFRLNALPAVLPFFCWAGVLIFQNRTTQLFFKPAMRAILYGACSGLFALLINAVLNRAYKVESVAAWTPVMLWDLAGVSIRVDENLLPPALTAPNLQVVQYQNYFQAFANPSLFDSGLIRHSFYYPYGATERSVLVNAWRKMIVQHPHAYWMHRLQLARFQYFGFPRALPSALIYVPEIERTSVLPIEVQFKPSAFRTFYLRVLDQIRDGPMFALVWYFLFAILIGIGTHRYARVTQFESTLFISSVAHALPLLVIAGSAEFRYVHWSVLALMLFSASRIHAAIKSV